MIKRNILIIALIAASLTGMAQSWQFGLKGTFNSDWLLNNNLAADKMTDKMSFGYAEGLSIGFNLHEDNYYNRPCYGLYLEYYYESHNQNYAYNNPMDSLNLNGFHSAVHLNMSTIPLLFRAKTESGLYGEIGPQLNLIESVTSDYFSDHNQEMNYKGQNIAATFNKVTFSIALGAGIESKLVGNAMLFTIGIRGTYCLMDAKQIQPDQVNKARTTLADAGILVGLIYKLNYYHLRRRGH